MSALENLVSNNSVQKELGDFVDRFEQGRPDEGYSDEEAVQKHDQVAAALSTDQYKQAAEEAMGHLPADQRQELGKELRMKADEVGLTTDAQQSSGDDPSSLGSLASALNGKGGGLSKILQDGTAGKVLSSPAARAALAGIAAMAVKRFLKK